MLWETYVIINGILILDYINVCIMQIKQKLVSSDDGAYALYSDKQGRPTHNMKINCWNISVYKVIYYLLFI